MGENGSHPGPGIRGRGREVRTTGVMPFRSPEPATPWGGQELQGIVIMGGPWGSEEAAGPRISAFIWGGKVRPTPTLPFGRWKGAA